MILCAVAVPAWSEPTWVQLTTPHFVVVSDGGPKQAQEVALEYERFREVLRGTFSGMRMDPSTPVVVLACRDGESLGEVLVDAPGWVSGLYAGARDQRFLIFRTDFRSYYNSDHRNGAEPSNAYHEYVHALEHLNFHNLPPWVTEGIASFYSTFSIEGNRGEIGRLIREYARFIREDGIKIPVRELVAARSTYAFGSDGFKVGEFYAESWALMHYLLVGGKAERAAQLVRFITRVEAGTPPKVAAEEAFGNLDKLQQELDGYFRRVALPFRFVPLPASESRYPVRSLSPAEALSIKASIAALRGNKSADSLVAAAIAADPKFGEPYQTRGLLEFREGRVEEAAKSFEEARSRDRNLYLAAYYGAMLHAHKARSPEQLKNIEGELREVVALSPAFAPAYVALSTFVAQDSSRMAEALQLARKAVELDPSRPGYLVQFARIALLAGKLDEAAAAANVARNIDLGRGDVDAATYLLVRAQQCRNNPNCVRPRISAYVPVPVRPAESDAAKAADPAPPRASVAAHALRKEEHASELPSATGVVTKTPCGKPELDLELRVGDDVLRFNADDDLRLSWPDTTWFDTPYANFCYVIPGARTMVSYRAAAGGDVPAATAIDILEWMALPEPAAKSTAP
jgi:tetratricopeptide (TPR) repeat protein